MTNLLHHPLDMLLLNLGGLIVCVAIIVICICRINVSKSQRWRVTLTQLMLICYAFWAFGTFMDLWRGELIGAHRASAGVGILLYLYLSYRQWQAQEAMQVEALKREALVTVALAPRCSACPHPAKCIYACIHKEDDHAHSTNG